MVADYRVARRGRLGGAFVLLLFDPGNWQRMNGTAGRNGLSSRAMLPATNLFSQSISHFICWIGRNPQSTRLNNVPPPHTSTRRLTDCCLDLARVSRADFVPHPGITRTYLPLPSSFSLHLCLSSPLRPSQPAFTSTFYIYFLS